MTKAQLKLTAALLDLASEQFSNHGCNDLQKELVELLSQKEWDKLNQEYHNWNGDPEEYRPGTILNCDWAWMSFMAEKLRKMADKTPPSWE